MKTETCKLFSRDFWIFLPNFIKIDHYNFELYRFKVGAFFEKQCSIGIASGNPKFLIPGKYGCSVMHIWSWSQVGSTSDMTMAHHQPTTGENIEVRKGPWLRNWELQSLLLTQGFRVICIAITEEKILRLTSWGVRYQSGRVIRVR